MKTQEELTQLKTEYETLNNKLKELSDDELKEVTGGKNFISFIPGLLAIGTTQMIMGLASPQSTNTADKETKLEIPPKAA